MSKKEYKSTLAERKMKEQHNLSHLHTHTKDLLCCMGRLNAFIIQPKKYLFVVLDSFCEFRFFVDFLNHHGRSFLFVYLNIF
jgi:hypothetical protein